MNRYKENTKIINNFYDAKLIQVIKRIPIESLTADGILEDEVREVLIYHLDIALYNRMEFNSVGEFIYQDVIRALRGEDMPRDEINNINQQRRNDLMRILDLEITADQNISNEITNLMIGYGYIDPEVTGSEDDLEEVREYALVRRVLMQELAPDENNQEIATEDVARILDIFKQDLEYLRNIIDGINERTDAEMKIFIEEMMNPLIMEYINSVVPTCASETSTLATTVRSDGLLSSIMLNATLDTVGARQEEALTLSGLSTNPNESSVIIIPLKFQKYHQSIY